MNPEQKYIIKYLSMKCDPVKNLYWFKDLGEWITDPTRATQFNNPEGITEVGRLLVEHEWVTRLIPMEEIQMVGKERITEPKEFVVLLDVDGDPVDLCFPSVCKAAMKF